MNTALDSSVALVTGANRGIGRALVVALLERGAAKVYATARRVETLTDLAAAHPGRVVPLALDVTNVEQVADVAAQASDAEVIFNNAGAVANPDLFGADLSGARQEFEVNYWGTLNVIRAIAPRLKAAGRGALVNVSSVAGLTNFPLFPTYSDSKAAVHSLTVATRLLLNGSGVQVFGVYPGPVDTDMAKDLEMPKASPADVARTILNAVEEGTVDIFTDAFAEGYAAPYSVGHKILEQRVAQMLQPA